MDFPSQTHDIVQYLASQSNTGNINANEIMDIVQERFRIGKRETLIGPSALISFQNSTNATQETPELLEFVESVFEKQGDQTIVCWSQESSIADSVGQKLIQLARNGKKKSRVLSGAAKLETVMKSFTTTTEDGLVHAHHVSRLVGYQFTTSGRMVGVEFLSSGLSPDFSRPFSVFYELVHGLAGDLRLELRLDDGFQYLSQQVARTSTLSRKLTLTRSKSQTKSNPHSSAYKQNFDLLTEHMKSLGLGKRTQAQVWRLLAAILHLGNVIFIDDETKPNDPCVIKNTETIGIVCDLLGVTSEAITNCLVYKSKRVGRDVVSNCLKAKEASEHRDVVAGCLYQSVVEYLITHINTRLTTHEVDRTVWVCEPRKSIGMDINSMETNYSFEKLRQAMDDDWFEDVAEKVRKDGVVMEPVKFKENTHVVDVYQGTVAQPALVSLLDSLWSEDVVETVAKLDKECKVNPCFVSSSQCQRIVDSHGNVKALVGVKHDQVIEYDVQGIIDHVYVMQDLKLLFQSQEETFLSSLFHEQSQKKNPFGKCLEKVEKWVDIVSKSDSSYLLSFNATSDGIFDSSKVHAEFDRWNIKQLVESKIKVDVDPVGITFDEFIYKYGRLISITNARGAMTSKDQVAQFLKQQWWNDRNVICGNTTVWLHGSKWVWLDGEIKRLDGTIDEPVESFRPISGVSGITQLQNWNDDQSDNESTMESEYEFEPKPRKSRLGDVESGAKAVPPVTGKREIVEKEEKLSGSRKCWTCCVWSLTWWIPSFCLSCCGGLKRPDIRMAWREKVALCIIIFLLCASLIFFIVGLRFVICPPINVLTHEEVMTLRLPRVGVRPLQPYFSIYGRYVDATVLMDSHKKSYGKGSGPGALEDFLFENFYGQDVSRLFYRQDAWEFYCQGVPRPFDGWDNMDPRLDWQRREGVLENFRSIHRNTFNGVPQLYADNLLQYTKGKIGWSLDSIRALSSDSQPYIVLFDNVYYTPLMATANVFPREIQELFGANNQGRDITPQWTQARARNTAAFDNALTCINNMFYIGTVDKRDTLQCRFTNAILFGASIVLVAVIGVKFLAALQFGTKKEPEQADKFCILMVPCYTEGPESLTKTLDSLSTFRYDDKRKLLFVICDGMIIGSGNDRPTPRIVLDILGVDASQDPEPLAFQSLGEGSKQNNMGKVYSGLYDIRGHSVPFIVVVKSGTPSERVKPGNRGKRDSQLILMRFLNRVHFNAEFSPLELELYHHMKNIIGVSPSFYEYILMVDADTEVEPSSLNRMISVMMNDAKIMGLCGETKIANEKESWVTMIQVYEYFISHHLAKAFESLFGTVTCLPGCFSMYRIRTPNKNIPVLVSPGILEDYSVNTVDTLHKKNLLHLGEDRYLTTLLLKHFPTMRTKFTAEARCHTVVPDKWNVLLSQRRRWINSTVHNLLELFLLDQLCGFCCFSMRFIVMLDLFATFVQPATILYIGYLIYAVATSREQFPLLSLILIGAIYGFQIIIFIVKREWQHIAWMFIYLAATPVIAFYIPCYAFWHFDDFSWGNTRVVVGEGKKTVYVTDTEPFDPKSIPLKRWRDFEENDLWEADSVVSGTSFTRSKGPQSEYSVGKSEYSYDNQPLRQKHVSMISFGSEHSSGLSVPGPFPSQPNAITDEILYNEIQQMLVGADLMTLTKKQIRDRLSVKLGVDLRPKKELMNRMIDEILSRQ